MIFFENSHFQNKNHIKKASGTRTKTIRPSCKGCPASWPSGWIGWTPSFSFPVRYRASSCPTSLYISTTSGSMSRMLNSRSLRRRQRPFGVVFLRAIFAWMISYSVFRAVVPLRRISKAPLFVLRVELLKILNLTLLKVTLWDNVFKNMTCLTKFTK